MKNLYPIYGILAAKKAFKNKNTIKNSFRCIRELKTHSSSIQYQVLSPVNIPSSPKNLLNISENNPMLYHRKMFSANITPQTKLMDSEVFVKPNFYNAVIQIYNLFLVRIIDEEFKINEFVDNSKTALAVVTKLISELKFSELNGLLTEECIAQVEKNVKKMSVRQRQDLPVELDDIYYSFPYQSNIIKSNNDKEKNYFQITVVYYIYKTEKEKKEDNFLLTHIKAKKDFTAYNCRFIKELNPKSDSQWIINNINIFREKNFESSEIK